tara:strand:- start:146 stop:445 length:300 start_codon:yes stop_codon:yes gene_type:complete
MKILTLFTKTKEEKEKKAAARTAKALKRGQEALLDKLEARKDSAQEIMDRLVEGKISSINTDTFNQTYHDAKLDIVLVEKEIEIAKEVQSELYSDDNEA